MNQNPSYSSSQPVTPAMIAAFQHQKSTMFGPQSNAGNINPAQLVNGSVNPTQLLPQQHNGMAIPGGGSINPAALTAASPSSSSPFPQQSQQHFNSMLQVVGMTREQFHSLSHHDRQTVGEKYRSVFNAHQQQQQQQMAMMKAGLMSNNNNNNSNNAFSNQAQNQNFYDRPSSSASSHSQQPQSSSSQQPSSSTSHHMMPPPPLRPPTAQGSSRPGTSQVRSPTIPGSQQAQMLEMMQMKEMMQQGQQRSQSRMVCCFFLPSSPPNSLSISRLIEVIR